MQVCFDCEINLDGVCESFNLSVLKDIYEEDGRKGVEEYIEDMMRLKVLGILELDINFDSTFRRIKREYNVNLLD